MRYRRDTSAGVIVFRRVEDGCRFLLVLSRLTKRPLWEFPKGGVDEGETTREAAMRELQEETGLGQADVHLLPGCEWRESYRFSTGEGEDRTLVHKKVTYFLAESGRSDVQLSPAEASDYAWLTWREARRRIKYARRREILDAAASAANCQSDTSSRTRETSKRSESA